MCSVSEKVSPAFTGYVVLSHPVELPSGQEYPVPERSVVQFAQGSE